MTAFPDKANEEQTIGGSAPQPEQELDRPPEPIGDIRHSWRVVSPDGATLPWQSLPPEEERCDEAAPGPPAAEVARARGVPLEYLHEPKGPGIALTVASGEGNRSHAAAATPASAEVNIGMPKSTPRLSGDLEPEGAPRFPAPLSVKKRGLDPDLRRVIHVWPSLPPGVRQAIGAMIDATST